MGIPVACALGAGAFLFHARGDGYAIPGDVCGTAVPSSSLGPLLPDGGELTQEAGDPFKNVVSVCYVDVDGESAVDVEVRSVSPDTDLQHTYEVAPGAYGLELFPSEARMGDAPAVLGPEGALVLTSCPANSEYGALLVNVRTYQEREGDVNEQRRALEVFTEHFIDSYGDKHC